MWKKTKVLICPRHGKIYNIRVIGFIVKNTTYLRRIALCPFCLCYYIEGFTKPFGYRFTIDGLKVRLATKTQIVSRSQVPNSSLQNFCNEPQMYKPIFILPDVDSRKGYIDLVPDDEIDIEEKETLHEIEENVFSTAKGKLVRIASDLTCDEYYIDIDEDYDNTICPKCDTILTALTCNVAMYDIGGEFRALRSADMEYCYSCRIGIMQPRTLNKLLITNNGMQYKNTFRPMNTIIKNRPDTNIYYFAPIAGFSLTAVYNETVGNNNSMDFNSCRQESTLAQYGYNYSYHINIRHNALDHAAQSIGVRPVVSFLMWLIRTHVNGYNAIPVWEEDIKYVLSKFGICNYK